jgi:replicative DNA helicase
LKTPWEKFNDATTDGLEWHSMTVIGGRPGSGKTLIKDQIVRESFRLNPDEKFRVLEFQFEMLARTSAIREFSSVLGKSYKYLCSADGKLSNEDLTVCYEHAKERVKIPIDIVEEPLTVNELRETITAYMNHHAVKNEDGTVDFTKTVVTLDHSLLLKKAPFEKDKFDTLYNLGEMITELKRRYPIAFIVLTQLNRDIFGSDALLQHADTLIGINRPAKQKIRFYGPDKYIIENDRVLVLHFLKCRNGDARMSFFKAEFERMRISEMPTPPQQEKRIKI